MIQLPPLKILLAEDGLVNQTVARRLLEKYGHTVSVVGDGREALCVLAVETFDVVLMDIQMPELDGLAATAEIRNREKTSGVHLPIIAMTAHAMKGDRERCLEAGMDGYVSKPIRGRDLFKAIAEVLAANGGGSETPLPLANESGQRAVAPLGGIGSAGELAVDESTPAIDWERALDQAAGDRELVLEMIEVYFDELPTLLSRIEQAIDADDGSELRRAAHTLKGALHHLAAEKAANIASELEGLAAAGPMSEGRRLREALINELNSLEAELHDFQIGAAADTR